MTTSGKALADGQWLFDHRQSVIVFADPGRDVR
jgi:hypothetical protein